MARPARPHHPGEAPAGGTGTASDQRTARPQKLQVLHDRTGTIQLFVDSSVLGAARHTEFDDVDRGDWLGAEGTVITTRQGELSVGVEDFAVLGKALLPPPDVDTPPCARSAGRRHPAQPRVHDARGLPGLRRPHGEVDMVEGLVAAARAALGRGPGRLVKEVYDDRVQHSTSARSSVSNTRARSRRWPALTATTLPTSSASS
ncbi:hypothetical protein SAMN05660657_04021 [Geodermatophilus amargosae]|uniref:OB domain-containing protein n=1 Tax=Geodermatophilus amargosae TaxID=1296565 RepID=A0A1I7C397_9ACTN|nr:OB-fold nucleic acid binding domain-containing protein [Geodermatophilus amargosae]SFT93864.1 hypothetical protein SAMN05660657_04021 [Geodermatophilus amargosae]